MVAGSYLRELRREAGLSQGDIAKVLGVSRQRLSAVEASDELLDHWLVRYHDAISAVVTGRAEMAHRRIIWTSAPGWPGFEGIGSGSTPGYAAARSAAAEWLRRQDVRPQRVTLAVTRFPETAGVIDELARRGVEVLVWDGYHGEVISRVALDRAVE